MGWRFVSAAVVALCVVLSLHPGMCNFCGQPFRTENIDGKERCSVSTRMLSSGGGSQCNDDFLVGCPKDYIQKKYNGYTKCYKIVSVKGNAWHCLPDNVCSLQDGNLKLDTIDNNDEYNYVKKEIVDKQGANTLVQVGCYIPCEKEHSYNNVVSTNGRQCTRTVKKSVPLSGNDITPDRTLFAMKTGGDGSLQPTNADELCDQLALCSVIVK